MKYTAAVIGLGRMGSTFDDEIDKAHGPGGDRRGTSIILPYCHGPSYFASDKIALVAGADPDPEKREKFGNRWEIEAKNLFESHQELLKVINPDILSVCTTAKIRSKIVIDAARSGVKAIWAEKPISTTLKEADEMIEICEQNNVVFAVNCAIRWNPYYYQVKTMIDEGVFGKILQITGYGSAYASHNGSHLIDTMRFLGGGGVSWVFGEVENERLDGDKDFRANGYLAFKNGARGYLRSMDCGAGNWNIEVIGEKARFLSSGDTAVLEFEKVGKQISGDFTDNVKIPFPKPARFQGMGLTIIDDLIHGIETGSTPRCSGKDGLAGLEIAIALRESHLSGNKKIMLPIKNRNLGVTSYESEGGR